MNYPGQISNDLMTEPHKYLIHFTVRKQVDERENTTTEDSLLNDLTLEQPEDETSPKRPARLQGAFTQCKK